MQKTKSLSGCILLSFFIAVVGIDRCEALSGMVQYHDMGVVHEAFVTQVGGNFPLVAVSLDPPEALIEKVPRQLDMQAEWIGGYWAYDAKMKDFLWVSGVWRRPPPGHQWIAGFWKKYAEGWVRIPGFWSRLPLEEITCIADAPPDALDPNTAPPPTDSYFWAPGYWSYDANSHKYLWISGAWEELDPNWVFVPAHYMWRPGGYVFVPPYWDFRIEERGTAYASVQVNPEYRSKVAYEPALILKPEKVVENLFAYFPNYLTFFHHHWYFHPKFWQEFGCEPPWWGWDTWWCFAWQDQWALWWWYAHPEYPQPFWITREISSILPAPNQKMRALVSEGPSPVFISRDGVLSLEALLTAINKRNGSFVPVVSAELAAALTTQQANLQSSLTDKLYPQGVRLPLNPAAYRPNVRKPVVERRQTALADQRKPQLPLKPKIPSNRRSFPWQQTAATEEPVRKHLPVKRPTWSPKSAAAHEEVSASEEGAKVELDTSRGWRTMDAYQESKLTRPPVHKTPGNTRVDKRRPQDKYRAPTTYEEGGEER